MIKIPSNHIVLEVHYKRRAIIMAHNQVVKVFMDAINGSSLTVFKINKIDFKKSDELLKKHHLAKTAIENAFIEAQKRISDNSVYNSLEDFFTDVSRSLSSQSMAVAKSQGQSGRFEGISTKDLENIILNSKYLWYTFMNLCTKDSTTSNEYHVISLGKVIRLHPLKKYTAAI